MIVKVFHDQIKTGKCEMFNNLGHIWSFCLVIEVSNYKLYDTGSCVDEEWAIYFLLTN